MKTTLLLFAAAAAVALPFAGPVPAAPQEPDPRAKDAEPLPEAPKLAPANTLVAGNPEKTFFLEQGPDKKFLRVMFACEVCLREGNLEVFLCKKNTKEHESILRVDLDARLIHAALEAAGAKAGTPTQFVNPKTNAAEYKPATGAKLKVLVHYRKDGKLHTHPGQEWVWNKKEKKSLAAEWVFAGSILIRNPDQPAEPPYYAANSGEVITISNFPYAMLDVPVEISKDDASLNYECKTDRIPPLFSKVWVILEPVR
ncbi:MAG: YdjY domain-containing protein [Gemmataceae bacterium]|nr:YdjY domain-containing protein [Gemmataceae bacterium]